MVTTGWAGVVEEYLALGLAIGRHIPGFVDAYYGPPILAERIGAAPPVAPGQLVARSRELLVSIDQGVALGEPGGMSTAPVASVGDASRRRFLRAQVLGLLTSACILSGETIAYADEVESCYGIRPSRVPDDDIVAAHRALDEVVPGTGPLRERLITWREAQAIPPGKLRSVVDSLAEDLRERTQRSFGLPDGEQVEFVFVENEPWSGFNYYLGDLRSRVAINVDLPVLSTSIAHLVAHEAYPGHHTEHTRKEAELVRHRRYFEESIFLVGTPQCLIAEGLADLGLEVLFGHRPESLIAEHLVPLGIAYDPDVVAVVAQAGEALSAARANAAFRLHEDRATPEVVTKELARFGLLPQARAEKAVEFLMDPTWRAYITCYVEGLPLCRRYVAEDPARFARLITEQCTPADLLSN